ncbi:MAG: D-2-hydroxyacid dehydrogenase [Halobacteriales archaeon]
MVASHTALIPHTLRERARRALAGAVRERLPDLEVRTTRLPSETVAALEEATILLTMGLQDAWYDHLDGVRWIQALSAGVDHYDRDRLAETAVVLTNASGVHATPIAEQVVGYLLMFERNLLESVHKQHRGVWERHHGGELGDRTLGVVGLGAIGTAVAEHGARFGMEVVATTRTPSRAPAVADEVYPPDRLAEVLTRAEYLVLAVPLTDETRGMIDQPALRLLPDDAVVVNVARGPVVVESDLVEALQQGRIRGAALDVFEEEPLPPSSPLWDLHNVVITPHMAGSTPHYWERCADVVAANYGPFAEERLDEMPNRVA